MITLITDRKICSKGLINQIKFLIDNKKIDQIILREKDLCNKELFDLYSQIALIIKNENIELIVNTNEEFIKEYSISSFHLSQKNLRLIDKNLLKYNYFGVSVHSIKEAKEAIVYKPDYLLVSHIFKTKCKMGLKPKGIELLNNIKKITDISLIALGGIDNKKIKLLKNKGFSNVAMRSKLLI